MGRSRSCWVSNAGRLLLDGITSDAGPNDHHGGMLLFFSGLVLLIVATPVMVPGVALICIHRWRWWAHVLPVVTWAFLFVFLS